MATFAAVNGTLQPVFNLDTQNGPIAGATSLAGLPVQPQVQTLLLQVLQYNHKVLN